LEVVISAGLLSAAFLIAVSLVQQATASRARMLEHQHIAMELDNIVTDLQVTMQYNDAANQAAQAGQLPQNFHIRDESQQNIACSTALLTGSRLVIVSCRNADGVAAQRVVRLAAGAPLPGTVLSTPGPQSTGE
jgi:alkylation response protein AidB-like acyl-CoA dehydrogenase